MQKNLTHKSEQKKNILIYILSFILLQFYAYAGFSDIITKGLLFILIPMLFLYVWKIFLRKEKFLLFRLVRLLFISYCISVTLAWAVWDQSLSLGYRITAPCFVILFYFLLIKKNVDIKFLETYIWIFGWLYCILWLYALSQAPQRIFGFVEDTELTDLSRGMIRINFRGRLSLILCYFLAIVKYITNKKKIFLILAIILYTFIVLQLTRQLILWTAVVTFFYLLRKKTKMIICTGIAAILVVGVSLTIKFEEDSVIGAMISLTEKQQEKTKEGQEDIRITAYKYFFQDYSKNFITDLFGSGQPHANSAYGKYNQRLADRGLYLSDVGYARMYAVNGLFGLILYCLIFFYSCKAKLPGHLMYVKLFMLFMIPANIAASWYNAPDGQICMCICIYIIGKYRIKKDEIQHNNPRL